VINAPWTAIPEQWGDSPVIKGELVMEGGTLNTGGMHLGEKVGVGIVELQGGVIHCADWFQMKSENTSLNVAGGMLIIGGDQVSLLRQYIDDGWITAYDGMDDFELDFGVRHPGETTLTAHMAGHASKPSPAYGAQQISTNVTLSWSPGEQAASHRIFFGSVNPPPLVKTQSAETTTYIPGELSLDTTYYWRIDEVNESRVWQGGLWTFTTGSPPGMAHNPSPAQDATYVHHHEKLRWMPGLDASSHDVYFGTSFEAVQNALDPHQLPGRGNQTLAMYDPGLMQPHTTYYWRIDERNVNGTAQGPVWSFTTGGLVQGDGPPPYTDYCAMLSQEIQGKKHGFMAGNLAYYIGGFFPVWKHNEDETLGFTHPFHHDLRSRGHGMVDHPDTGYGHDYSGWEFYKTTKVAYGSVYVGTTKYTHPVPKAMYWRPDKMICEYQVGGVKIYEEKFIADNDVACTIISSDAPITLEFAGQSFANKKTITSTATCELDATNNAVHVVEGGTIEVKPVPDEVHTGVLMYDGMSTVLSASKMLTDYTQHEVDGQWFYQFKLPCDGNGVSLVWVMDDEYDRALAKKQDVLADPAGHMAAKTQTMNDLLNYQMPYFRCSDQDIVDIYYYLWSLYFMYFINVGEGFEQYPHTQTAVNNFLGMHRYDACFQIPVGSWTADKESYANGNTLIWSTLLPYANLSTGRIPADNLGIGWYSGLWGAVTAHVEGAWQIYEHSGDIAYLQEVYDFYKGLMWRAIRGMYKHHVCAGANACTLGHLKGYNLEWGIPVSPESLDIDLKPWGDEYSNFNAGKILLILEGIAGISYSVVDHTFTVSDHMPQTWEYMDVRVPIKEKDRSSWTSVTIMREQSAQGGINKTVTITGNTQAKLHLQPWLEEKNLLSAPEGYVNQQPDGHIGYRFDNTQDKTISIVIHD
jgi:hypothetical protein